MCGRYTHLLTWGELVEFSRLGEGSPLPSEPAEFKKRYNQAPTEKAPVVRIKDGRRELVMLRWGWGKMKNGNEWINARSEGIATSGAYAQSFRLRRCLIPASGFFEWRKMPSGRKAPYVNGEFEQQWRGMTFGRLS